MRFGPAGVPLQCPSSSTYEGIKCTKALGLDAMEMEFVRGVRMKQGLAKEINSLAKELDVKLSSHAPYYINLATKDKEKAKRTFFHIYSSAKITHFAGGYITVVHPGYYQQLGKEEAYRLVKKRLEEIVERLKQERIKTLIGIETMGKVKAFGKIDEVLSLSQEVEQVYPVIDFAHLRALQISSFKKPEDFVKIIEYFENGLGSKFAKNLHIHFSEIEFTEKGEKNHLVLGTKYEPDYRAFLKACVEQGYKGVVISESPEIDKDAVKMKKYYERIRKKS